MTTIQNIPLLLLFASGICSANGQTSLSAAGGNATGSGGSAAYSYGQVIYTYNESSSSNVAQGVQQPYEISIPTGFEHTAKVSLAFAAYPNPTTNLLILKAENTTNGKLTYSLYDANGKRITQKNIIDTETPIAMAEYASGTYLLKITTDHTEIQTFKINKN